MIKYTLRISDQDDSDKEFMDGNSVFDYVL